MNLFLSNFLVELDMEIAEKFGLELITWQYQNGETRSPKDLWQ